MSLQQLSAWQSRDNFSRNRHQEIIDAINGLYDVPSGELNTFNTRQGKSTIDTRRLGPYREGYFLVTATRAEANLYDGKEYFGSHTIAVGTAPTKNTIGQLPDDPDALILNLSQIGGVGGAALVADQPVFGIVLPDPAPNGRKLVITGGAGGTSSFIPLTLSEFGGVNGTQTTAPTFTYTAVRYATATAFGSGPMSPIVPRPHGWVTAATAGIGIIRPDTGAELLWLAHEIEGDVTCADASPAEPTFDDGEWT